MTVVQNKYSKITSWGLGPRDPAAKEHMMAYDKQTIKRALLLCKTRELPLRGCEEPISSCKFL
jgi:hypothetical protein